MSQASNNNIIPPPGLQEATKNSTYAWQGDLEQLFRNAKDRFPDVVWEVGIDENDMVVKDVVEAVDEVWGHKAIVYARAPPSFQTRYFSFRQPLATFPVAEYPDESESINNPRTRTPSPSPSTTTTATTTLIPPQPQPPTASLLRLTSSINSTLFSNELEYLYTGKGFGEAFEFLFDSSEPSRDHRLRGIEDGDDNEDHPDPEALRIDKLRKDLVFMWRSRLYSDVRIALTGNFSSSSTTNDNTTTAIFSSHRFILVSRSPYFHTALLSWPSELPQGSSSEPPILNLPSPPFTPASLHFTLGFMYTGTLIFSHRSYDLSTAFTIMRASMYLSIPSLHDEIQARIVQEMLHGLFHAFIPFEEYERLTGGKWGTGGCRCRQCARRVPRVLEFAITDDVKNTHLERGAWRALVGHFGEGWVHQEFASLPLRIRESILKRLAKRTTPLNIFPLLFAAEHALGKLGVVIESWGDISREMILNARKTIDEVLCKESEACFNSDEWMELMEADGVRFEDGEKVEWSMAAVLRGVKDPYAACLYQTLVSSILLRPHPTDVNAPLLPATSHVRVQVEQTRLELLRWIGKRWLGIRQERGFDPLEGWALKEISDHIEVPIEDLLNPAPNNSHSKTPPKRQQPTTTLLRPTSNHPHTSKVDAESDMASSMRVSVLSRSLPMRQTSTGTTGTTLFRDRDNGLSSSTSSVRNTARTSSDSYASAMSGNTMRQLQSNGGMSPAKMIIKETRASSGCGRTVELKERPDSKLTPSVLRTRSPSLIQPSILEPEEEERTEEGEEEEEGGGDEEGERESSQYDDDNDGEEDSVHTQPIKKVLITRASLASVTSRSSLSSLSSMRPKSSASSVRSQNTVRKSMTSSVTSSNNSSRSRLNVSVPKSPTSPVSRPTRTYRISTTGNNTRPTSSLSSIADSTTSYRTASTGLRSSPTAASRRTSGASTISMRTPSGDKSKSNSPVTERTRKISGASVNSVASNAGSVKVAGRVRTTSAGKKPAGGASGGGATPPVPVVDPKKLSPVPRPGSIHSSVSGGSTSTGSNSTSRKVVRKVVLKKKSSGDGDRNSSSPLSTEPSVKESEVEVEVEAKQEEMEKAVEKEEMDVNMEDVKEEDVKEDEKPVVEEDIVVDVDPLPSTSSTITIKPNDRPSSDPIPATGEHKKSSSSASTASSVVTLKRKGSSDTIKTVKSSPPAPIIVDAPLIKQLPPTPISRPPSEIQDRQPPPLQHQTSNLKPPVTKTPSTSEFKIIPQGTTLEIGIPCIIASKRKRFKAYARYIGEVEGEIGAWVGVEVPMPFGDSLGPTEGGDKVQGDDRQWNDGSWGGVRYFEIGGMGGSEWDYGGGGTNEDRASRRRRVDGGSGSIGGSGGWGGGDKGVLKREGDQFSIASASEMRRKKIRSVSPAVSDMSGVESRGLFVRPQQVLYVVGAVGVDL